MVTNNTGKVVNQRWGCFIGGLVLILAYLLVSNEVSGVNAGVRAMGTGAPSTASSPSVKEIGYVGNLALGGVNVVLVGSSEDNLNALVDAQMAKDKEGFDIMLEKGHVFGVTTGTKARILGYGSLFSPVYHIRILTGTHSSEEGWIPMEALP